MIFGITGFRGRLGSYLLSHYDNFVALDCDVTKPDEVKNCIGNSGVDVVVHLAAKSGVDWCEKPENKKLVTNVNLRGTFNVCLAAEKVSADVLLLSSDHVFSGKWGRYKEKDKPNPVNFYGMSKMTAEGLQQAFDNLRVVRTSYLFDRKRLSQYGAGEYPSFIFRSFMYLPHFAESIMYYLSHMEQMPKILHVSGYRCVSWYKFMSDLLDSPSNIVVRPRRVETEINGQAPRPKRVGLNTSLSKKLGLPQYSYVEGIEQMKRDWK